LTSLNRSARICGHDLRLFCYGSFDAHRTAWVVSGFVGARADAGGGASGFARAADRSEADALVEKARLTVREFAQHEDFVTLRDALGRAKAVMIFPQVLKAGFVVGGSGGSGVLMVHDEVTGRWSDPAFYTMGGASLGLQAGASAAEVLMVVSSQKALDSPCTRTSSSLGRTRPLQRTEGGWHGCRDQRGFCGVLQG
jgi:lipid-binding SYLF domain-containing protein